MAAINTNIPVRHFDVVIVGAGGSGLRAALLLSEAGLNAESSEAVNAASLDEHVAAVRALDRVLTAGRYVIPVSYPRVSRIAHAARLHFPDYQTLYGDWPGFLPDLWWSRSP